MPDVRICEMAPRDGVQAVNAEHIVPPKTKVKLIEAVAAARPAYIEVGSFVSPRAVLQMADTLEVCRLLKKVEGVEYAALVANLKYYESFKQAGLHTVAVMASASEAYSQFNVRRSIAEATAEAGELIRTASRDGYRVRAHLSAAFHDIDGTEANIDTVVDLTHRLLEFGCECVALADTKGTADPRCVRRVLQAIESATGLERIGVHFHDSFGTGLANALAAYECGVRTFDASVAAVGGTPFSRRAKGPGGGGNIATEELVYMFNGMGISTGVRYDALLEAGEIVEKILADAGDPPSTSKILARHRDAAAR